MERTRVSIVTLVCVLFCKYQRIFGTEVNMRVKSGDSITLFCDREIPFGSYILWIRNSSYENQSSLLIDTQSLFGGIFPRFSFVKNSSSNSFDLHIENISASDQGLYYCAKVEKKISKDDRGIIRSKDEYQYGDRRTVLESVSACADPSSTTSPPPVSDCVLCWTLLFSVCPVCVLLCSICVYCLCQKKTTGSGSNREERDETQTDRCDEDENEVYYATLEKSSKQQKQLKKNRVQDSEFSTYSEIRTKRL